MGHVGARLRSPFFPRRISTAVSTQMSRRTYSYRNTEIPSSPGATECGLNYLHFHYADQPFEEEVTTSSTPPAKAEATAMPLAPQKSVPRRPQTDLGPKKLF